MKKLLVGRSVPKMALPAPKQAFSAPKQALSAYAEQRILEQFPVDTKALRRAAKYLDPKRLKLVALVAVGGGALLSLLASIGHERLYQAAVARELKRQLAPLNAKLDRLETQNEELRRQNEALKERLPDTAGV